MAVRTEKQSFTPRQVTEILRADFTMTALFPDTPFTYDITFWRAGMWLCPGPTVTSLEILLPLVVFLSQFQKELESSPSQCPASPVWPLSTVTHVVVNLLRWVNPTLIKSHFMTKTLFLNMLGSPFGHHWGLSYWTPEKWPSENYSACFQPGSGRSTTVVRTC